MFVSRLFYIICASCMIIDIMMNLKLNKLFDVIFLTLWPLGGNNCIYLTESQIQMVTIYLINLEQLVKRNMRKDKIKQLLI